MIYINRQPLSFLILLLGLLLNLTACTTPAKRIDKQARQYDFSRSVVDGEQFKHVVYTKFIPGSKADKLVHIYIGGDGRPWRTRYRIAEDPTQRKPLMLELMALDSSSSIYLGRPCYLGLYNTPSCSTKVWTSHRYSSSVVHSMITALNNILHKDQLLVLIGYSGGGALAMLMAEQLPRVKAVVTIAGNLDTQAWTEFHGYTPLRNSLNPAMRPPLNKSIRQVHFAGGRDRNVVASFIEQFALKQYHAEYRYIKEYTHRCCWVELWSLFLAELE